jgi:hypothetical protein
MKVYKLTDGVFSRIVGDRRQISDYDRFINLEKDLDPNPSTLPYLKKYKSMVTRHKAKFKEMATLEDLIMLHRIRQNRDIQLSVQREYIYARQPCPRTETKNQDLRLCIANAEFYDIENLSGNKDLMDLADNKICKALDELIYEKEKEYNLLIHKDSK